MQFIVSAGLHSEAVQSDSTWIGIQLRDSPVLAGASVRAGTSALILVRTAVCRALRRDTFSPEE